MEPEKESRRQTWKREKGLKGRKKRNNSKEIRKLDKKFKEQLNILARMRRLKILARVRRLKNEKWRQRMGWKLRKMNESWECMRGVGRWEGLQEVAFS